MAKTKDSLIVYQSFFEATEELPDVAKAEIWDAMGARLGGREYTFKNKLASVAWKFIVLQMNADKKKWDATCAKRAEAGREGGLKSGESRKQTEANEANAYFAKQTEANEAESESESEDNTNVLSMYVHTNPPKKKFVPPTIADIEAYCVGRTTTISATREGEKDIVIPLNKGYALDFFEFYENKEWKIGNQKMKSWQLAFMKWNRANYKRNKGGQKYGNANNQTSRNEGTYNELSDYSQFDE